MCNYEKERLPCPGENCGRSSSDGNVQVMCASLMIFAMVVVEIELSV